jgi:hypothetical protein
MRDFYLKGIVMTNIETMKQVLRFLEHLTTHRWTLQDQTKAIELQRQAIEQAQQAEPVAVVAEVHMSRYTIEWTNGQLPEGTQLYTFPPPRQPLLDEEISNLWDGHTVPVFGKTGINPIVFARAINAAEQREQAQQAEPVQTEPNFEQTKQIMDNLERCLHRDSKYEFLRVWIRDWTNHKLSKHTPPRQPLTDEEIDEVYFKSSFEVDNRCEEIYAFVRAIEAAHGIKENT